MVKCPVDNPTSRGYNVGELKSELVTSVWSRKPLFCHQHLLLTFSTSERRCTTHLKARSIFEHQKEPSFSTPIIWFLLPLIPTLGITLIACMVIHKEPLKPTRMVSIGGGGGEKIIIIIKWKKNERASPLRLNNAWPTNCRWDLLFLPTTPICWI